MTTKSQREPSEQRRREKAHVEDVEKGDLGIDTDDSASRALKGTCFEEKPLASASSSPRGAANALGEEGTGELTQGIGEDVEVDELVSGLEDVGREVDETKDVESRRSGGEGGHHGEGGEGGEASEHC